MGPAELQAWAAYERVEPWGERRQDLRAGRIMALLANALRPLQGLKVPPRGWWTAEDFYPPPDAPARRASSSTPTPTVARAQGRQTPQQMETLARVYFGLLAQRAAR